MNQTSPLPWRSVYPVGSTQRCAAVASDDHYVYLHVFADDDHKDTVEMHKANARLIIAAVNAFQPMLDALEGIAHLLESVPQVGYKDGQQWSARAECLEIARTALDIAKKEGE